GFSGFVPDPITHGSWNPVRHVLAIGQSGQPDHLDPQGARACCKVGLDRPLIPTVFVANLFRSARVCRPRRSPDRGSPVTHRRPGRGKGSLLNSDSLTPKPLASSVYVHVLEAHSPLKRSISVMSLFPSSFPSSVDISDVPISLHFY